MKPYIILDIDQDFFFNPILSSTIVNGYPVLKPQNQHQSQGIGSIYNKFIPYINSKTEIMNLKHHNELGEFIRNSDLNNIILYHLDAHSDVDPENLNDTEISISNWITATYRSYNKIYWILGDVAIKGTELLSLDIPPMETCSLNDAPNPQDFIDLIVWTDSPGWCPQNMDLFSIFKNLIG